MTAAATGCGNSSAPGNTPNVCAQAMCDSAATCSVVDGVAKCACPAGMDDSTGNGKVCSDRNECLATPGPCGANATCTNTPTSYTCACEPSFTRTGAVCSACTTCAVGQYQTAACTATADATCAACPTSCAACTGAATCTSCMPGFHLSAGTCITCSSCSPGQYQVSACSPAQDTTCATCSVCPSGQFRTVACGGSTNITCVACSTCAPGQFQAAACAATQDTTCTACATCGAGHYQAAACGPTTNTVCTSCGSCGAGKYVSVICGVSSDTVCASCDANCDTCTGPGACTACATGYALNAGTCVRKGTSCRDIHLAHPSDPDGVYRLDPDGGSDANAFFAFCDMTADGGGWMKILQYTDTAYTPSATAVGDIATAGIPAIAKLADADVNSLSALATVREYRIQGAITPKKLFMKAAATWDDTARGHGLIVSEAGHACEALTNCTYVAVTTAPGRPTIDSYDWSPSSTNGSNDLDRYFTDYNATPDCYAIGSTTQRCYSTGFTLGHALIPNLSIWTRELPVVDGSQ